MDRGRARRGPGRSRERRGSGRTGPGAGRARGRAGPGAGRGRDRHSHSTRAPSLPWEGEAVGAGCSPSLLSANGSRDRTLLSLVETLTFTLIRSLSSILRAPHRCPRPFCGEPRLGPGRARQQRALPSPRAAHEIFMILQESGSQGFQPVCLSPLMGKYSRVKWMDGSCRSHDRLRGGTPAAAKRPSSCLAGGKLGKSGDFMFFIFAVFGGAVRTRRH